MNLQMMHSVADIGGRKAPNPCRDYDGKWRHFDWTRDEMVEIMMDLAADVFCLQGVIKL